MINEKDKSASNQDLVEGLRRFDTFSDLRRSDFYRKHEGELRRLFSEPKIYRSHSARPRLGAFLRVVEWNIERGSRLDEVIDILNHHPVLGYADLLLLNELDDGMVRSGNLNVARELSRALSAHAIYGVEYLEMTKGVGRELNLPGENTSALHGNAILTRNHFSRPEIIRLPRCENNFESTEKRLGGRIGILVNSEVNGSNLLAATTHLDVINTPRCRAKQMRALLSAIESRLKSQTKSDWTGAGIIIGGDLNSHTFARGGRLRTTKNVVKIFASNPARLARKLLHPESSEPALMELARFGYETEGLNDRRATARTLVSSLEDARRLPGPLRWWVMRRIGPSGLVLEFRLDWLAARGLRVLGAGEVTDKQTGVASVDPQVLAGLTHKGSPIADHDPIVIDLAV